MENANVKDDAVVSFLVDTLERADASLDPEDLLVTATSRGLQIEPHHIRTAFDRLQQHWQAQGELNDEALDRVAGGVDRQLAQTAFQNFDQKTNQTYNMLSSVLKTIGEMRGIGAGSRSGL